MRMDYGYPDGGSLGLLFELFFFLKWNKKIPLALPVEPSEVGYADRNGIPE